MEAGGKLGNTFVQMRKDDLNIFVVVKMKRSRYILNIENTGLVVALEKERNPG